MSKTRTRVGGFAFAFLVHATAIILLSIAVVQVMHTPEAEYVPEPLRIEIGEQVVLPPQAAPDAVPDPTPPPAGPAIDEPEPDSSLLPPKPDAMFVDPFEQMPTELKPIPEGLEGEPRKEPTLKDKIRGDPGTDSTGQPLLFGQPIEGTTVFLLDLSGSMAEKYMGSTRLEVVVAELTKAIQLMDESDSFDIVVFSGYTSGTITQLWGKPKVATPDTQDEAVEWLKKQVADGGTPTAEAMRLVCERYRNLDNFVLITDGIPDAGNEPIILGSVTSWMAKVGNPTLVCISVGGGGLPFVKRLVDKVGGAYVLVE